MSLAVAIAGSIALADELLRSALSLRHGFRALQEFDWKTGGSIIYSVARDPRVLRLVSDMLSLLATTGCIFVLIALFRCREDGNDQSHPERPALGLLTPITGIAAIVGGITVLAVAIRVLATPYTYLTFRDYALQIGRGIPPFSRLFIDALRDLTTQLTVWTAPWLSTRAFPGRSRLKSRRRFGMIPLMRRVSKLFLIRSSE